MYQIQVDIPWRLVVRIPAWAFIDHLMPLTLKKRDLVVTSIELLSLFVELGDGVGDVPVWCRDGAYVKFGFR